MTWMRFLTLAVVLWNPAPNRSDEKAATPEQLVASLQAAEKSADLKAPLRLYGGPHRKLNEQAVELLVAARAFDKALDDEFGKDPSCRSCFAFPVKAVKAVELKGKKDLGAGKVELTIWTIGDAVVETREVAIQENGGWVFLAPAPFTYSTSTEEIRNVDGREVTVQVTSPPAEATAEALAAGQIALPQMRAVFERGARDVAAGKHADRQTAVKAVDDEVAAAFDREQAKIAGKRAPK